MIKKKRLKVFRFQEYKRKLSEGLHQGDLRDLVLPVISVDEFDSKIDEEAIVVAFFVNDDLPAKDLMFFIEQSYVELLDTEVSPAPNEEGYFLVFVEFLRNDEFPEILVNLLNSLNGLTKIKKWKFKPYKYDAAMDATEENIKKSVRLTPQEES